MAVWNEALWLVRAAGGRLIRRREYRVQPVPRQESRRLAEVMRALPDRYAERLPERTLERVAATAAAGEWENAVQALIAALSARSVPVGASERAELAELADTLGLPADRIDDLRAYADAHQAARFATRVSGT